ncbi:hypothetical protein, partial [Acinetobacter soli]|uniref:hypothetical protein n=1 Tax=Acinetobacter soli TaxID=487316 RepID=UPI001BC87E26
MNAEYLTPQLFNSTVAYRYSLIYKTTGWAQYFTFGFRLNLWRGITPNLVCISCISHPCSMNCMGCTL